MIGNLPTEIWLAICDYLCVADLLKMSYTCKYMRSVFNYIDIIAFIKRKLGLSEDVYRFMKLYNIYISQLTMNSIFYKEFSRSNGIVFISGNSIYPGLLDFDNPNWKNYAFISKIPRIIDIYNKYLLTPDINAKEYNWLIKQIVKDYFKYTVPSAGIRQCYYRYIDYYKLYKVGNNSIFYINIDKYNKPVYTDIEATKYTDIVQLVVDEFTKAGCIPCLFDGYKVYTSKKLAISRYTDSQDKTTMTKQDARQVTKYTSEAYIEGNPSVLGCDICVSIVG